MQAGIFRFKNPDFLFQGLVGLIVFVDSIFQLANLAGHALGIKIVVSMLATGRAGQVDRNDQASETAGYPGNRLRTTSQTEPRGWELC
jgi:hypothetical protein